MPVTFVISVLDEYSAELFRRILVRKRIRYNTDFLFVLHCCLGSALLCTCLAWCMEHKHGVILTQYSPHSASLI